VPAAAVVVVVVLPVTKSRAVLRLFFLVGRKKSGVLSTVELKGSNFFSSKLDGNFGIGLKFVCER